MNREFYYFKKIDEFKKLLLEIDKYILGQEYENQPWTFLFNLKFPIRRTLCINELVFDIDARNWEKCHLQAKYLEDTFNKFNIPFLRYTSGNWLHYHIFIDGINDECLIKILVDYSESKNYGKITTKDLRKFLKELKIGLFDFILKQTKKVKGAKIDEQIVKAERHMIRFEGARNEKTGYYKSLLLELPKEQPKIKQEDIILPKKIELWNVPDKLWFYVYMNFVRKNIFLERKTELTSNISINNSNNERTNTIYWIELILQNSFTDGRKRLIDLVILPYLLNVKKLSQEEALKICFDWALKCHALNPLKLRNKIMNENDILKYINYKIKHVLRYGLKPLSFKNLSKHFNDCDELKNLLKFANIN
ncbi:MAG: DNA primase noncatalytic subunit PriX [Candidatus Aenigmatarchaeota archaeon]